jgi:hypothetical protein
MHPLTNTRGHTYARTHTYTHTHTHTQTAQYAVIQAIGALRIRGFFSIVTKGDWPATGLDGLRNSQRPGHQETAEFVYVIRHCVITSRQDVRNISSLMRQRNAVFVIAMAVVIRHGERSSLDH